MKARAQEDSKLAYEQISALADALSKTYGNLCHHFPTLVLRSGLCQAVAFYTVKAVDSSQADVYQQFLSHMAAVCGVPEKNATQFQCYINEMGLDEYRHTSRRLLAAAIWYKRFADSLLNTDATGDI